MRKTVAISLILCLVFQTFSKTTLIAAYVFNKQLIVDVFCVNKEKVEMHCEGSCFMNKQLEQDDSKELPAPDTSRDQEVHLFFSANTIFFNRFCEAEELLLFSGTTGRERLCHIPVFHPPQQSRQKRAA